MGNSEVDIVLTWVDESDLDWQHSRNEYLKKETNCSIKFNNESRYRDWECLRYVFRGIEKHMPWINKVYFVTCGHLPKWLNVDCEKIAIVKHEDYIPKEYLPTFNSNTIDLNMFRIKGLSEYYINFNDDTFVINQTTKSDFFKNGKPRDLACLSPQPIARDSIRNIELNNLEIINDYFSIQDIKKNIFKWINPKYGLHIFRTIVFMNFKTIIGIFQPHIPISHLKSIVEELWKKEFNEFDLTCRNRFRSKLDINDWLSRSWQLLSGNFEPRSIKFGKMIKASNVDEVKTLKFSNYKVVCINDDDKISNEEYLQSKNVIIEEMEKLFPEKSNFEKE